MSVLERPTDTARATVQGPTTQQRTSTRIRSSLARLRPDAVVLVPLLAVAATIQRIGLYSAPQRIDDEGTYVAQAWAVFHLGDLTHYTYWYDHPPLGWLQIALWTQATAGFDRAPNAVGAGREFMLVICVISATLLWFLARRLALPRWAAAVAVALFSFSPLAVQFHRTVYLDNVATPWLLGAFLLVLTPRRRLVAFAGAAVCFGVAVLSKETTLLLLPVLAWLMWQRSRGETRRYAIAVSVSLFALMGVFYVLFALLKGEVMPGPDHTSLVGGVLYQLGGRAASGSIFDPSTLGHRTVSIWTQLDTVLPALILVAIPLGLGVRRLRPFVVAMLILLTMLVRPGYLPVPFVIALIPFGSLLVAGVASAAWEHRPGRADRPVLARAGAVTLCAAAATLVAVGAPGWATQLRGLTIAPLDQPMTDAVGWVDQNVPRDQRILTDDAIWVDLVTQGRPRGDVVWFYKPDTDPGVPKGAASYQWVVSTDSVRSDPASFPTLSEALSRSEPVASFGAGERRVEVRRVLASNPDSKTVSRRHAAAAAAGQQLVANPALSVRPMARAALLSGRVDPRVLTVLAMTAARHRVTVADLPQPQAETAASAPRRAILLSSVDGQTVGSTPSRANLLARELQGLNPPYRPATAVQRATAQEPAALLVSYPIESP